MNPQDQPSDTPRERQDFQPGQTISPRAYEAPAAPAPPQQQQSPSLPAPEAPRAINPAPAVASAPEPRGFYHADTNTSLPASDATFSQQPAIPHPDDNGVAWTASEFIAHEKSGSWFMVMGAVSVVIAAGVYLLTRDIFNTVMVAIAAIIFGVAAGRQPRQIQYGLDDHGIYIGRRFYPYGDFRSFSVADEGPFRSIVFAPLKRFMPPLNICYDPADEDRIAEVLSTRLPMNEHKHDLTERLMRRIRF